MAKNVKINGVTYNAVSSLSVPLAAGDGNAVFPDTSDANATAGDIIAPKTAYVNGVKLTGEASMPSPYTSTPAMDGVGSAGVSDDYSRGDHVHPSDTAKISTSQAGAASGVATLDANTKLTAAQASADIVTVTANKTLGLTDAGKYQKCTNSSAITVTVPTNASVAFPIGTEIEIAQLGAGDVTVAAAGGVTIRSKDNAMTIGGQYASVGLKKLGTDEWQLVGDLA